jgi:competence protein ComEC
MIGGGVALVMILFPFSLPRIIAAVAIYILAVVYGGGHSVPTPVSCDLHSTSDATLVRTVGSYATHTRSVFKRDDGCLLFVYVPISPKLIEGARVTIEGKQELVEVAFSSLPDYAARLREEGIQAVVRTPDITLHEQGHSVMSVSRLALASRMNKLFGEPDAGILVAMTVGDRGMIPRSISDSFRKSGITHILSISGFHVSLLAGILAFLLLRFPLPVVLHYAIMLGVLWTYIWAIGFDPAAVRAGLFWTCYMAAYRTHSLIGLPSVILITCAIVVTSDPSIVRSIGFELSVAAVCGIGMAAVFLRSFSIPSSIRPLVLLVAVSLGATIATLPLTAYYFGTFSLIGIVTNMIVVPLVAILMYVVLFGLALSFIAYPLALLTTSISHAIMSLVLLTADTAARVPYGSFQDAFLPGWGIALYYVVVCCACAVGMRYRKVSIREFWV